jgi:CO/xanthine dehydrogenase Mo-binding subunit
MEKGIFLADIYPHQFLYGITVRSPVANGYLKSVNFPKLTSGISLIKAKDIPGENRLEDTDMPILADSKLSYIGQPVAILLGQDKSRLEDAFSRIEINADEERANFICNPEAPDSIITERNIIIGEPDKAFEKAHRIVRGNYSTGIQEHWYAEPTGAVCWYEQNKTQSGTKSRNKEKTLVIRTASQWPNHVKRAVSRALGPECRHEIAVEPTTLSLHMDGKLIYPSLVSCHAALGAWLTGKPVRLILNHEEDFFFSPKRSSSVIKISSALDEKGKIIGSEIEISVNLGAFGVNSDEIIDQYCLGSLGFYHFNNIKLKAAAYGANIPPQGSFCGFGLSQGFFAAERHVSQIAGTLKLDPALWRKQHININEILPVASPVKEHSEELIEKAAIMSGYYRKWASYELLRASRKEKLFTEDKFESRRGIGIALAYQGNGMFYSGECTVEVTFTKESELQIKYSMTGTDNNLAGIWAALASHILSIEQKMVHVMCLDSGDSGPSCSSRNITVLTRLVEKCCTAIRKQRFHDPLPISVRRTVKPQDGYMWRGRIKPDNSKVFDVSGFLKPGWACSVVEVTIDQVENIPKVRGIWLSIDGGKILNEEIARSCLYHSAIQALGWSLTEHIEYIDGKLTGNMFDNYSIPGPEVIPPVYIEFINNNSSESRGIGDIPFSCIPAAFLQAVSQAMDADFNSIPLKKQNILAAKKNDQGGETPK